METRCTLHAGVLTGPSEVIFDHERRRLPVADTDHHRVVILDLEGHV